MQWTPRSIMCGIVFFLTLTFLSICYAGYDAVTFPESDKPGELIYRAEWRIWIPDGVKTLRGVIVHQHGCGLGSCDSGRTAVDDLHWQSLAKKHDCALIGVSYRQDGPCEAWCHPQNGSARSFLAALDHFGKKNGHPELNVVPWAMWGHSGGGHWCGSMVQLYPERIVGAWLRSGHPDCVGNTFEKLPLSDAAKATPIILNLGLLEKKGTNKQFNGIWSRAIPYVLTMRKAGAMLGVLVDPKTSHECGNSRYPAIRFLDICLTQRLPEKAGTAVLRPMPQGLVKNTECLMKMNLDEFTEHGLWYPSADFFLCCRQYSKTATIDDTTPPPPPSSLSFDHKTKILKWEANADPESGLASFRILRNGVEIARIPEKPNNRFGLSLFQGLSYSDTPVPPVAKMEYCDTSAPDGLPSPQYRVSTVNTVGLESDGITFPILKTESR